MKSDNASQQTSDRLARMRETYREIVESYRGESEIMSDYRWACDEIERLRAEVRMLEEGLSHNNTTTIPSLDPLR